MDLKGNKSLFKVTQNDLEGCIWPAGLEFDAIKCLYNEY